MPMKPFEIVKPGKHTSSNGTVVDFSEDALRAAAAAYDPSISPAPIVVGHPKDNGPAYGWVKSLDFNDDGNLVAAPEQLDAEFEEMVAAGRFRTRSASWYLPDSPANPVPGTLYLRHVGFLGAQPPAVKGLKDVSFSEADGVVEFTEVSPYIWSSIAGIFRGLREYLIGEKGMETADKVLPNYAISDLDAESRRAAERAAAEAASIQPTATPAPAQFEEMSMTPEQIAALQAENERLKAAAQAAADFAEKQADLANREAALARKELETTVDGLIAAGKILPATRAQVISFAMALADGEAVVEFGEGDQVRKLSHRAAYLDMLQNGPKLVDFSERSAEPGNAINGLSDQEIADKAADFREDQRRKGIHISAADAVKAVKAGKA